MRRFSKLIVCMGAGLMAAGCPKGKTDYSQGRKAERLQDYDAAYDYYQKALKNDPENAIYLIKFNQARFEASSLHVKNGAKLRERGQLEAAASEFQRALAIDPSSPIAEQELRKTVGLIEERNRASNAATEPPKDDHSGELPLASMPPELKPLPSTSINLTMENDAKIVYETIAKLAGITAIFDPDFPARRIPAKLNNVTLEQALEIVSLESKAFWKAVTENIIFVIPDTPAKRREYEENVVRTFYLSNTVQAQDLTEVVTGLRSLLDLKRITQLNGQNAVVIRDSPDKLEVAQKIIGDIDKAKPEVVVQVQVVEARVDKARSLGIAPGQTASIAVVPPGTTTSTTTNNTTGTTTNNNNTISLQSLGHLTGSDYAVTLPSFTANALLNDSTTKIIQNPLVNTQFQYQDVGVNIDLTPRVHPNHEVSLKLSVEVSSVTGQATIGGIQQPIISQRKIEQEIRLKEGESNVLGGLITRTDTKSINGWPGLAHIPLLRYFFSEDIHNTEDDEILIILTPHIVRMPEWTRANLRALYSGSEAEVKVRREAVVRSPNSEPRAAAPQGSTNSAQQVPGAAVPATQGAPPTVPGSTNAAQIRFEPRSVSLKVGQKQTVGVVVENVNDLFSIPFLLQYNPAVISVEEVQHGEFLSGGNQEIAIVCSGCGSANRGDKEHGQAIISATRQPNTAGVSGTGTIMGIVVKAIAPGSSNLSIVQVNAKDSQQRPIPLVTVEATLQVQP